MKKVNVYHMWVPRFIGQTKIPVSTREIKFEVIGTVEGIGIDPEIVWHLTNHSCWNGDNKEIRHRECIYTPTSFDRGYTNDDICFELDGVWWCATPGGWHKEITLIRAKEYLEKNSCSVGLALRR